MQAFLKKPLLLLIGFLALLFWVIFASPFSREAKNDPGPAKESAEVVFPVEVSVARKGNLVKSILTNGVIRARREAEIITKVDGEITIANVLNGNYVNKGSTLFKIDDREYRLAFERAQAALLQAQIDYKTMTSYEEFVNADTTQRGEKAALTAEKFRLAEERFRKGTMSLEDFERARREYETDTAFYSAHREDVIANKSGLAAARELFGRAKLNLEWTEVKAPFSGYVADCNIAPGQHVQIGRSVMKIIDVSTLLVDVDVLEDEIGGVRLGAVAEVIVNAFPDKKFFSRVKNINPIVDPKSKAVRVTIGLKDGTLGGNDAALRLRPGMFATVRIETQIFKDRVLAPKSALLIRDQRPLVFVAEQDLAKWHYIELGEENEEFIEIRSGVNVGDSVIVDGHYTLAHDAKIRVRGN